MKNEHIQRISKAITVVESSGRTPYSWECVSRNDKEPTGYNWAWKLGPNRFMSILCDLTDGRTTVLAGRRYLYLPPQSTTLKWEGVTIPLQTAGENVISFEDRMFHREVKRPIDGLGTLLRSALEVPLPL